MTASSVCVLGAGSWGTALAILLSQDNKPCRLWAHSPQHAEDIDDKRCNARYLPDVSFPDSLDVHADLKTAISNVDIILLAIPSHVFRETLKKLAPLLSEGQGIAWATKGLEADTHTLLSQVVAEEIPTAHPSAVISGPTFAKEVAAGLPTAVTVASTDEDFASKLAERLHTKTFRAYTSHDIVGVQVGGAVKNVLAIAAGIADGLGFGANTRSALITRGLAEISRLGHVLGADAATFMGLAGLGDLVLTCTDDQSRNRRFGKALSAGQSAEQAFAEIGQVVEGAKTAKVVDELATKLDVDMPICKEVYRVIYEQLSPKQAVTDLLLRSQKSE